MGVTQYKGASQYPGEPERKEKLKTKNPANCRKVRSQMPEKSVLSDSTRDSARIATGGVRVNAVSIQRCPSMAWHTNPEGLMRRAIIGEKPRGGERAKKEE